MTPPQSKLWIEWALYARKCIIFPIPMPHKLNDFVVVDEFWDSKRERGDENGNKECIKCICGSVMTTVTISNFRTMYQFHGIRCDAIIHLFIQLSSFSHFLSVALSVACSVRLFAMIFVFLLVVAYASIDSLITALLSSQFMHSVASIY